MVARLHRALLRLAHNTRHRWRMMRGTKLRGVSVIARNMQGEVLLVRHSYGPQGWYLPGGGIGWRETADEAAARELLEETACVAQGLTKLGEIEETISESPHTAHIYLCSVDGVPKPDGREIETAEFFALGSLPKDITARAAARLELIEQ